MSKPEQGLGRIEVQMVNVMSLNLERIMQSTKFDFGEILKPLQLRVSFYSLQLDLGVCPITYSQEILVQPNQL